MPDSLGAQERFGLFLPMIAMSALPPGVAIGGSLPRTSAPDAESSKTISMDWQAGSGQRVGCLLERPRRVLVRLGHPEGASRMHHRL